MEEEDFLDLSIEDREDKLTLFNSERKKMGDLNYAPSGGVSSILNILGPGLSQDQIQDAITWGNTKDRNRYEPGDELNSKFEKLFPELEGLEFPSYEVNEGAVNIANANINPDNTVNKWQKISNAIDDGTQLYNNQERDGVITNVLVPEGTDEDVKLNLMQYGQVMRLTSPEFNKQISGKTPDEIFADEESRFAYINNARNFQGTKFKVNALRHVAKKYGVDMHPYIKTNKDFFTYKPELRDDEEFMKMYNDHLAISDKYSQHLRDNYQPLLDKKTRDAMQTMRLTGAFGADQYLSTSVAVGVGGLVDKVGDLLGGVFEIGAKYGRYASPGGALAAIAFDRGIDAALGKEEAEEIRSLYNNKVEGIADSISGFFDTDNWKDTAIGQFAYIPDDIAGLDLSENPSLILPNTLKVVGEMVPAIVGAAYTGGGSLVAGGVMGADQFFTVYHRTNNEARELGVDFEDREALSLSIGTVTGVTSGIFNNPLARKGASRLLGIEKRATEQAVKTLANAGSRKSAIGAGTKAYFKEVVGENIEELVQGSYENYAKYSLDQKSPEPIYGASAVMSPTEFVNTLILTSAATSILVSPNIGTSSTQIEKEAWTTAGLDYDKFEGLVKAELKKKKPKFDETTAKQMLEKAKAYEGIVKPLKAQGKTVSQIVELANLEYNNLQGVKPNDGAGNNIEPEVKKEEIEMGIPKVGAQVSGNVVTNMIETIGDSKVDNELDSKLANIKSREFKLKRVNLEKLYNENKDFKAFVDKNPDLEFDGPNKSKPGVIDQDGNVIDGMKRMASAYLKGQKGIRVFNEFNPEVSSEIKAELEKEVDNIVNDVEPGQDGSTDQDRENTLKDIEKLGLHFQRVFKGSTISFDQDEFNAIAKAAGHDPKTTKGLRNRNNNQIYINPSNATLDTPIHEFTHIWEDMLLEQNPEAHAKALKLLEGTKYHKSAIDRGYGDNSLREALVDAIGIKAAKIFKDPKRQSQFEQVIEQVKEIIRKALNLDPSFDFDIQTDTLNNVIESSAEKIMSAQQIQSPKSMNASKPQGLDPQVYDMQRYRNPERDAIRKFEALQEEMLNDPTSAELKPLMKDGKYQFVKNKNGSLSVKLSGISYALMNGLNAYYDGTIEEKIDAIGDKIVDEYNANTNVPSVVKGIGWYSDLHATFRNIFGSRTNFFGRLIGASSTNTNVDQNYEYAIKALQAYSKGSYDTYMADYKSFIDRVEQYQDIEEINQFFNEYKGRAVNAIKEQGGTATQQMRMKPDPKDINVTKRKLLNLYPVANPLFRTDNPTKRYGMNSPKIAQVLMGIWLDQSQQTKTNNFYKNVVGLTTNPTIDLWAARTIRRMVYDGNVDRYRIPSRAEQGVDERVYAEQSGGLSDYQLAEEVILNASEKLNMPPDDLQAYLWFAEKDLWYRNGWAKGTAAKKADFRDKVNENSVSRYFLGLSTERDSYQDTELESKENKKIIEDERKSIESDLRKENLISLKVNETQGQYLIYPEASLDVEMIVESDQDVTSVYKRAIESARKHEQESMFMSKVLPFDERLDPERLVSELRNNPNARPAVEIQFRDPLSFDEAKEFAQNNLDRADVQLGPVKSTISGYTFMTNEKGDAVLGVKYQFIPEFVFENEEDVTQENINQAMVDWIANAKETKTNLESNQNILYFYNHYVDTQVAHRNQYNNILTQIDNGSRDIFSGTSSTRTRQFIQSKARRIERQEGSSDFDAQREQDQGDGQRFSGTISSNDGGPISRVENRRIDRQSLPSKLSELLNGLQQRGFQPSQMIEGIKIYSQKVDGRELTTEEARIILSKHLGQQGFRQRGFETGSITKDKDNSEASKAVYDFINENPAYYKTMNMQETMEMVVEDIENQEGGFENAQVIKDLIEGDTKIEELPRVQLARQASLRYYANKLVQQRSDAASTKDIDATLDTMARIERSLARDATKAGQASAALRSWTAQTPQSLIDRIEIAIEKHNEGIDNQGSVGRFLSKIFGGGKKIEQTTLSTEQKSKIIEYHELLGQVPENSELANGIMRSAFKYMDGIVPSYTWQDTFFGLQYAALLSGISTQVLNFTSGMTNIILQPLMDMARVDRMFNGTYFDFMRKFGKGTNRRGLEQGAALAKDIMKNGARVDKYTDQADTNQSNLKEGRYNVLESTKFKQFKIGGIDFNPYNYYKYVGRMLNATDRFIAKVGYEGRYFNYLVDQLRKDGVPSNQLRQKASDLYLATQVSRDAQKELQEQLDRLKQLDPDIDVAGIEMVRMRELMHDALVQRYSEDFANKTDEELQTIKESEFPGLKLSLEEFKDYMKAKKQAEINGISEDANLASSSQVFIDNRQGLTHPIAAAANFIRYHSNRQDMNFTGRLILKSFVPFTSIIGSIGEYMIDTIPVAGLGRAYLAEEGLGKKGTRMRDEQLSRGYFGMMSFLGLAAVALRNGQEDDDEPLIQVSGGGFNNPNQYTRGDMKNAELPPYSIQIGGVTFDYRNAMPLAVPLAIIGNYNETFKSTGGEGELFDDVKARTRVALANSFNLLIDQSVLTSIRELLDASGGILGSGRGLQFDANQVTDSDFQKRAERMGLSTIRSVGGTVARVLPQNLNLFRQLTKIFDASSYSASDVEGATLYALGLSQVAGKPRIDIFGEAAKSYPGETVIPYTHWMNIRGKDPLWQFIDKYNAYPSKIRNRPIRIGRDMRELTDDELYQHQITSGREFKKLLREYVAKAEKRPDYIRLKRGQSSSMHRDVIKRLWTVAQNKSLKLNRSKFLKTEL